MDLASWIVWAVLVVEATALGFIGFWFSLRTLRSFAWVTGFVLIIAVTRFGLTHAEYARANLVDSFLSGADQVTIALLHPVWPGKVPAPGVAGRWIIAFTLLLSYRMLEGWALRWQPPELDLSAIGRGRRPAAPVAGRLTVGQYHAQLAAELRFRLPTMEVRAPAILPGGTKANALASLAERSGISGAGVLSAVFRFAGMFWPRPRLVRVRSWVEEVEPARITVLLEDVKTGLPIATKTVSGDNFNEAASMVAGYIARQLFAMDRTVPEWCYGAADGRDLGAMQLARLERVYAACPKDVADSRETQIAILSSSTASVRTAGIVRYELAQLLALQGQQLESLRLHALNRELHQRFYRGRYRFAMSLEMLANPEHYLPDAEPTWRILAETLEIISRCGITDDTLQFTAPPGHEAPRVRVPRELALKLLKIAETDLREVRTQLNTWHVVRDAIFRRDERAVWLPHWRPRHRQAFQDGICAAELLVAIRCRLLEPGDEIPSWLNRAHVRWHLRRAIGLTSFIGGDPTLIIAALTDPHGRWWDARAGSRAPDRVRGLRWGRSSTSWQAAYNTACLYAVLVDAARTGGAPAEVLRDLEHRVIDSLRGTVENPHSELERSSDWIASDPDFQAMRHNPRIFTAFANFLLEQMQQEYPDSFMDGKCSVPHTAPSGEGRR